MREATCILCGTNEHVRTLYPSRLSDEHWNEDIFSARRAPDRVHGEFVRCSQCGLVFQKNFPEPHTLQNLYLHSAFTYGKLQPYLQRTYMRYVRRAEKMLRTPPPRTFLDVGCGNGFMLSAMRDRGYHVMGIEPSQDAAGRADSHIQKCIAVGMANKESMPAASVDLLTCFQTFDHLQDPREFVRLCHRSLRPGGVALFINHDIGSCTAKLLGERCPMIDVEHTFLHTKKTMRMLFEFENFLIHDVFSVRNDYPLSYWLHMAPLPSSLKKCCTAIARMLRIDDLIIPLYAGNLGIIVQKPQ